MSKDQELQTIEDDRLLVKATVSDTAQLRWWLLGFAGQVEVIKPNSLREEMIQNIKSMNKRYK